MLKVYNTGTLDEVTKKLVPDFAIKGLLRAKIKEETKVTDTRARVYILMCV